MSISDYAENKLLDAVFNFTTTGGGLPTANPYIALHTAAPGETGANEATGGSYARQQADFSAAASGTLSNTGNIDFPSMPAVAGNGIVGWSAWDAVSAGNCLWTGWISLASGLAEVRSGDFAADLIQSVAHGLVADNRVVFEAVEGLTLPNPLDQTTVYWVIATGLTTDAFSVSTTSGGAAVNLATTAGSAIWRLVNNKTVGSGETYRIATGDLDVFLD